MSEFDLPEDFAGSMRPTATGDDIRLPFSALAAWWKNGAAALKAVGGVQYFGGWSISQEGTVGSVESEELDPPGGWYKEVWEGNDGPYTVYTNRLLYFAPIDSRESWTDRDGHLIPPRSFQRGTAMPGAKSRMQYLGVLATLLPGDKPSLVPYGPVVLSVKGLMTSRLKKAIKEFGTATKELRDKTPVNAFYVPLGTFGAFYSEKFGKGQNQSDVTPIRCYMPGEITMGHMKSWFVGEQIARKMIQWKLDAAEWLSAFENVEATQAAATFAGRATHTNGDPESQGMSEEEWEASLNQADSAAGEEMYPF